MGFLEALEQVESPPGPWFKSAGGIFRLRLLQQNRSHPFRVARAGAAVQTMNKGLQSSLLPGTKFP